VHSPANTVTHVISHHGITTALRVLLNSGADVSQMFARPAFFNRQLQTLLGGLN
jgi:hypothetical protein